jgi:predicted Zn-dependent protease
MSGRNDHKHRGYHGSTVFRRVAASSNRLIVVLVLGLLLLAAGYAGRRPYIHLRQDRLIKQARHYLANAEDQKALLCLQRALRVNPKDLDACRLMAGLTDAAHSPSALLWRRLVVELNPTSVDDRLALAVTAMTMRDYASATNALEGVSVDGKKTAGYHNVAGSLASTINRRAEAEAHFLEASRLEPTNPASQLNLAVVRLHQTNAPALIAARTTLKQLSAHPTFRCQALRELVMDALRYQQTNAALAMSKELLQETNSVFSDRLLRLQVLRVTQNPEFKTAVAAVQHEAESDPGKIYEMAMWQMVKTGPSNVVTWLKSLPAFDQAKQPVALLLAQCQTTLKDWRGLRTRIKEENWGEIEFIRHLYLARALREEDLPAASKSEWDLAMKIAVNRKQSLVMLLQQAAQWNWLSEAEEILWTIVNKYPSEKWAVSVLSQAFLASGRTGSLMVLYSQQAKASPADLLIKNNLAMMALLLGAQEFKPHELAREVYVKGATNSSFRATYAFSLYLQKKSPEALKIMEQLNPKELEDPSIAGYYGIILKSMGNRAKAKACLELAAKAQLLPEERKLFESAKAGM